MIYEFVAGLKRLESQLRSNVEVRHWLERLRAHTALRWSVFGVGALICLTALTARYNGLWTSTDLLFYRLFSVARKKLFGIGLLAVFASALPPLRVLPSLAGTAFGWVQRAARDAATFPPPAELERAAGNSPWTVLGRHVLLAAIIGLAAFLFDEHDLLGYIDGQYLLTLIRQQADFAPGLPVFSTNPLQGLGDVWYTTNTLWIPETRFGGLFADPAWRRVAIHWFAFIEIFLATTLLSRWLGRSAAMSVAAGWLAVILITPLSYPPLVYTVSSDAPNIATSVTFPFLVVALWAGIGTGRHWHDLIRSIAVVALIWLHFLAISIATTVAYPFIACVCLARLAFAWQRRAEFWRKIGWSSAIVSLLLVSGFAQVLLGLIGDTAFGLFPQDLPTRVYRQIIEGSILFRPEKFGQVVAALGICGALLHAVFDTGRMQAFAVGVVVIVALIVTLSVAQLYVALPGPVPIYYEFVVWAVYPIFAVSLLTIIWRLAKSRAGHAHWENIAAVRNWAWLALPLAAVIVFHGANRVHGMHNPLPNIYPPKATTITELLRSEVGLSPGSPYRGRVATLTGETLPYAAEWGQMYELDIGLIRAVGNDHRTIGLWYYGIPTLVEFSQTMAPLIYAVVKRYLAYPDDPQSRNILHMRRPDLRILRLLGIRYIIADGPQPAAGMRRVLQMKAGSENLAVDEVSAPNLGISPIETPALQMDRNALEWLGDVANDLDRTALLAGPSQGDLVKATGIDIAIERGDIRVRAKSQGRSLVVVPFQFSHCLRSIARKGAAPELRRADLLLTGILFEGVLDAAIEYRQGAFEGTDCRLKDLADDRAFVTSFDTH